MLFEVEDLGTDFLTVPVAPEPTHTIKQMFDVMKISPFTHVIVNERRVQGFETIGGGFRESILSRFADKQIIKTDIVSGQLHVFVER